MMTGIVAIVGGTNSGKTTLMEKLIPELKRRGFRVGTIKHIMHKMVFDPSGKDSRRHAEAGADTVVVDADTNIVMFKSIAVNTENTDHVRNYVSAYFADMDIVLAEGYKKQDLPKIEVYRQNDRTNPVCLADANLVALVTDADLDAGVPRYGLDDVISIADLIVKTAG
ncbi:MAG: molybdopterin-guanine dinucleotide biosynthesis protein B [Desulfobacterales bacterium]